jgi:AmiR/NasT family two-component response regulator
MIPRDWSYFKQLVAVALPAGISFTEVVSGGNLVAASLAAALAVAAGRWALKKQRLQAETADLEKQIAEIKLQKLLDSSSSPRSASDMNG